MIDFFVISIALGMSIAAWFGCRGLENLLKKRNILDHPNPRGNHQFPTPRGGGIAIMITWAAGVTILNLFAAPVNLPIAISWLFLGLTAIMAVSWVDDLKGIPVQPRILVHTLSVLIALPSLPGPLFETLPAWFNILAICGIWVWFTNLYNFMDGIDGISGVQTVSICLGILVPSLLFPAIAPLSIPVLFLGAATLGFLICNWPPARIFLGDVGSIPIGFLLGWALLWLAIAGQPIAAVILPLYYLTDSGITLIRRLVRGARPWQAHSEHAYQQAVRNGMSHAQVAKRITLTNILLIAFAWVSLDPALAPIALIGAILCVVLLLCHLNGDQRGDSAHSNIAEK